MIIFFFMKTVTYSVYKCCYDKNSIPRSPASSLPLFPLSSICLVWQQTYVIQITPNDFGLERNLIMCNRNIDTAGNPMVAKSWFYKHLGIASFKNQ